MKFLVRLGDGSGEVLKKLRTVYGNGTLKAMAVYKCSKTTYTREDPFQHIMMKM